jgi:hypothetical protein
MSTTYAQDIDVLRDSIAKLEQRLQELINEPEVMDDEVNSVERDLQALRRRLLDAN